MTEASGVVEIRRGDVFWIAPEMVPGNSVPHPHVVVQDDVFNYSRIPTVIVCALTTNLHRVSEPGNVLLDPGEANLPRQSVIVVAQLSAVLKEHLGEFIGTLSADRVEQALAGLKFQQVSFFQSRNRSGDPVYR